MKITIIGAGKFGTTLAQTLYEEDHDITVIDKNNTTLDRLMNVVDVMGVVGNGASLSTLSEANVGQSDVVIAVTAVDEINLLAATEAKNMGARYVAARISNPDYLDYLDISNEQFGIDLVINPEREAALQITEMMAYPGALAVENFFRHEIQLVAFTVPEDSPLNGRQIQDISQLISLDDLLISIILRDGSSYIPHGDTIIRSGDVIYVIGNYQNLMELYQLAAGEKEVSQSIFIIGASKIAFHLVPELIDRKKFVKIVENNRNTALAMAQRYPKAEVVLGDGTDPEFLSQEYFDNYDAVVTLTGIDEENIIISQFANQMGVKRTITKVNREQLLRRIPFLKDHSTITTHHIFADTIIRVIRSFFNSTKSEIINFYRLANNEIEAVEFTVGEASLVKNTALKDLPLTERILVAAIYRDGKVIIPSGEDFIQVNDHVLIFSHHYHLEDIDDILSQNKRRGEA